MGSLHEAAQLVVWQGVAPNAPVAVIVQLKHAWRRRWVASHARKSDVEQCAHAATVTCQPACHAGVLGHPGACYRIARPTGVKPASQPARLPPPELHTMLFLDHSPLSSWACRPSCGCGAGHVGGRVVELNKRALKLESGAYYDPHALGQAVMHAGHCCAAPAGKVRRCPGASARWWGCTPVGEMGGWNGREGWLQMTRSNNDHVMHTILATKQCWGRAAHPHLPSRTPARLP